MAYKLKRSLKDIRECRACITEFDNIFGDHIGKIQNGLLQINEKSRRLSKIKEAARKEKGFKTGSSKFEQRRLEAVVLQKKEDECACLLSSIASVKKARDTFADGLFEQAEIVLDLKRELAGLQKRVQKLFEEKPSQEGNIAITTNLTTGVPNSTEVAVIASTDIVSPILTSTPYAASKVANVVKEQSMKENSKTTESINAEAIWNEFLKAAKVEPMFDNYNLGYMDLSNVSDVSVILM